MIMRIPFGTFWIRFRERCRATRDKEEARRRERSGGGAGSVGESEASRAVCG